MPICVGVYACGDDKPDGAFRHKTSGPFAGYRFPKCLACERLDYLRTLGDVLRSQTYTNKEIKDYVAKDKP